mmetsp:Transcript_50943/g.134232  ORF Transcript_50943/g.134232 Transcript_50943/m.134232 type:complete len:80 (+) Transcript_50943:108-347(+)
MRQVVGLLLAFVVAEPIKVNRVSLLRSANVDSEVADAMRQELTEERSQDGDNVELNEDSRICCGHVIQSAVCSFQLKTL